MTQKFSRYFMVRSWARQHSYVHREPDGDPHYLGLCRSGPPTFISAAVVSFASRLLSLQSSSSFGTVDDRCLRLALTVLARVGSPKATHFLAQKNDRSMMPQEFLLSGHWFGAVDDVGEGVKVEKMRVSGGGATDLQIPQSDPLSGFEKLQKHDAAR